MKFSTGNRNKRVLEYVKNYSSSLNKRGNPTTDQGSPDKWPVNAGMQVYASMAYIKAVKIVKYNSIGGSGMKTPTPQYKTLKSKRPSTKRRQ